MDPKQILTRLLEVGKRISTASETQIRAAIKALTDLLDGGDAVATEAAREALDEAMSYNDREQAVRDAVKAHFQTGDIRQHVWVYLVDCFDDHAICNVEITYRVDTSIGVEPLPASSYKLCQVPYTISTIDNSVTLGDPVDVRRVVSYVPVAQQESADVELVGDLVPLVEKATNARGTVPIRIIAPGWGSSGYYPATVLEKSAGAFKKGLHMHVDHPTAAEEAARPERSVATIGAVLETDARWDANGTAGPGLYAEAKPLGEFAQRLPELAPHIGVSIRALGKATQGEAEGRRGLIIQEIASAKSVDFVTVAGAGGKVLELFEAARGGRPTAPPKGQEVHTVDEKEAQALRESAAAKDTEIASLKAKLVLSEAKSLAVSVLAGIQMPEIARARLVETESVKPVIVNDALDRAAFTKQVEEAAKAELEYLGKAGNVGAVRGMGSAGGGSAIEGDRKGLVESWRQTFLRQGEAPERAQQLAELAVS